MLCKLVGLSEFLFLSSFKKNVLKISCVGEVDEWLKSIVC